MPHQQPVNRMQLLKSVNADGRYGLGLGSGCAVLLLPELAGDTGHAWLRYDRAALASGEYWRLLTAHIVHLDLQHALINALGFALLWALFARAYTAWQWLGIVLASAAAIDAGLWCFAPGIEWYVGSSGVLHGLMAAGALARMAGNAADGWLVGAFIAGKLSYEQRYGALPIVTAGTVVVGAHLYGALGGAVAGLAALVRSGRCRRRGV